MKSLAFLATWLMRVCEEGRSGHPSAKRFGLLISVTVLSCVMGLFGGVLAGITWTAGPGQSLELARVVSGSLEVIAGMVLTAVTAGYVGGKAVERRPSAASAGEEGAR